MPGKSAYSMAAIRLAVAARVASTSQRATAKELGISLSGLQSFLAGAVPYEKNRKRLVLWHIEHLARDRNVSGKVRAEDVDVAVAILGEYVAADGRADARGRLLREVAVRIAEQADIV